MQDFKACVGADASVRPMSSREFSQYPVGADAHIGPLGSCDFAEDFRKTDIFCFFCQRFLLEK